MQGANIALTPYFIGSIETLIPTNLGIETPPSQHDEVVTKAADTFAAELSEMGESEIFLFYDYLRLEHRAIVLKKDILENRTPPLDLIECNHFTDLDEERAKGWMYELIAFAGDVAKANDDQYLQIQELLALQHRASVGNTSIILEEIKARNMATRLGMTAIIAD